MQESAVGIKVLLIKLVQQTIRPNNLTESYLEQLHQVLPAWTIVALMIGS